MFVESATRLRALNIDRFRRPKAPSPFDAHPPLDGRERFVVTTVTVGYTLATATEKVAILLFPGTALQIALLVAMATIGFLCWRGGMGINIKKALLYLLFGAAAGITALANNVTASTLPSILFVYAVYSIYIFSVPISKGAFGKIMDNIVVLGVIAAAFVYIDWAYQLAGFKMPNIEFFIPKSFRFFNYVYIQPTEWGSRWTKPNGYWFLETSYVSQFCAMSLVIEACRRQRLFYLGATATGLLLSFGGTGMTLLALSIPVILFYVRPRLILIAILMMPLLFGAAIKSGLVENIESRAGEFTTEGKSGNQRFTVQLETLGATLTGPTREGLLGIGPGRMPQRLHLMWTPISKVIVEYGLFVYVLFWAFFFTSLFGRGVPFYVSWIVTMQYLFLNGSFLVPINSVICVMLAGMYQVTSEGKALQYWRPRSPRRRPVVPRRQLPPLETLD